MDFKEVYKDAFVIVGDSDAGRWDGDMVHPIPKLWEDASRFIHEKNADQIVGVCLPPRSDHYFYTCGIEIGAVDFEKVEKGMTLHTFPAQKYVVFKHVGHVKNIPNTYGELWETFDRADYQIKEGMPEIEVVDSQMFGKETTDAYEMEIWIPVE